MKTIRKSICALLSFIILISVVLCAPVSAGAKAKPSLNRTKLTLKAGSTFKLRLKNVKKGKVRWFTSKKSVAKVSKTGRVTAKYKGNAVITAKYKGKKYKCGIKVKPKVVNFNAEFDVYKNDTIKLTCTVAVKRWRISNKNASITQQGLITGKKVGKSVVTAECKDGSEVKGTVNILNPYKSLKSYISKNGKTDSDGNKYIPYKDNNYYYDISYINTKKLFRFTGYFTGTSGSYLITMDIAESGSAKPSVISYYQSSDEAKEYYATSAVTADSFTKSSKLNFSVVSGNVTDSEVVNDLSNSLLHDSFSGWKKMLREKLGMGLSALGFKKY